jgi:hypothetical protein
VTGMAELGAYPCYGQRLATTMQSGGSSIPFLLSKHQPSCVPDHSSKGVGTVSMHLSTNSKKHMSVPVASAIF